jgi:hypothetical protein
MTHRGASGSHRRQTAARLDRQTDPPDKPAAHIPLKLPNQTAKRDVRCYVEPI